MRRAMINLVAGKTHAVDSMGGMNRCVSMMRQRNGMGRGLSHHQDIHTPSIGYSLSATQYNAYS